jgi:hypothetical protein
MSTAMLQKLKAKPKSSGTALAKTNSRRGHILPLGFFG